MNESPNWLDKIVVGRRGFLGAAASTVLENPTGTAEKVSAALIAISRSLDLPEYYHGPIKEFSGSTLISPRQIAEITTLIKATGDPFIHKMVGDFEQFYSSDKPPSGSPSWVHPDTAPLPIVYSDSVGVGAYKTLSGQEIKVIDPRKGFYSLPEISAVIFGISIKEASGEFKTAIKGLQLVNSYTSLMVLTGIMDEYYQVKTDQERFRITNSQGEPLESAPNKAQAGVTTFMEDFTRDSQLLEETGSFNCFLSALSLRRLIASGLLPESELPDLKLLYSGSEFLDSAVGLYADVVASDLREDWVKQGSLLPPTGFSRFVFDTIMLESYKTFLQKLSKKNDLNKTY